MYGNLPYIAPEVIKGKYYTFASDVYSIAMLMWEISSGRPPFINHVHDYNLAINIINGMRPKIIPETPLEYKNLMVQCWDADPLKRPDINTLDDKMEEIYLSYHQNNESKYKSIKNFFKKKFQTSKSKTDNNLEINRNSNLNVDYTSSS